MVFSLDKEEKKRFLFVICLATIILLLFANIKAISWVPKTNHSSVRVSVDNEKEFIEEMKLWPEIVRATRNGDWSVSNESFDAQYLRDCWEDRSWLRLYADPYCTYLWMRVMQHESVQSLDLILAVITNAERDKGVEAKHNQNGGMRCTFSNPTEYTMRGYWKPCTSHHLPQNSETYTSELIAFYIDRILGFHRTPVVVPRYFNKSDFDDLSLQAISREEDSDAQAKEKLESVLNRCGSNHHNGAEGAMVGWANFPVVTLDSSNKRLKKSKLLDLFKIEEEEVEKTIRDHFNITNNSPQEEIEWAMENIAVNIFAILVGNKQKFGHSVFIMKSPTKENTYGPLLYIDNDRSNWQKDIFKKKVKRNHPLTKICKFPTRIATKILLLDQYRSSLHPLSDHHQQPLSLGGLVKQCADNSGAQTVLFTESEVYWLDDRLHFIANAINECVHLHGAEYVFIDEPWRTNFDPVFNWSSLLSRLAHY